MPRKFLLTTAFVVSVGAALAIAPGAAAYADATRDDQWMIDYLNLEDAWSTSEGKGVTVGVVDSGVDASHPDITNNIEPGMSATGESEDGLTDPSGHGTGSASLIAGHGHGEDGKDGIVGVAPGAKILPAQVVGDTENFQPQETADAIRWLADNGADVIAIGSGHPFKDETEHNAIKYAAIERGIPVVTGVGNVGEGLGPDGMEVPRTETLYPAGYEEVIGVSGVDESGKLDDDSMYGEAVTVAAPGSRDVIAAKAGGGTSGYGGTSAALSITAGILALLKSEYPDESRMELTWRLTELTTEAGEEGPDDKYGFGIVNPVKALTEDPGPLPADMKDPKPTGTYPDDKTSSKDDELAANRSDSDTTILIVSLAAAVAIMAAITLIILIRRMKRRKQLHTNPTSPEGSYLSHPNPPQPPS